MKSLLKPALPILICALSACSIEINTDDEDTKQPQEDNYQVADIAGVYQAVITNQANNPNLVTVSLIDEDNLTLLIEDELDQASVYAGQFDGQDGSVTFNNDWHCAKQVELICTADAQSIELSQVSKPLDITLADLSSDYQMMHQQQLVDITITQDGHFTAMQGDCLIDGQIHEQFMQTWLEISVNQSDCSPMSSGFIRVDPIANSANSLAVFMPNSPLAGYWFMQ